MTAAFTRSTLATLDLPGLTAAFNAVYQHYVVPFSMGEEQMGRHLTSTALDLAISPLWLDHMGAVAGIGALGVRGDRGWIGGFGLVPSFRGQGLGRLLLDETLSAARAIGLRHVELEVLCQNHAAIRIYTASGFRIAADLCGLVRQEPAASLPTAQMAQDADPQALLARLPAIRPEEAACWQREAPTLAAGRGLAALVAGPPDRPEGYLIYREAPTAVAILDIGATTIGAASTLIDTLHRRFPARPISLSNEPARGVVHTALLQAGWREIWRQHRMVVSL